MQSFKGDELPENPVETTNPISQMMFCFTLPTFFKGFKNVLVENDLFRALKAHKSDLLGDKLCKSWDTELRQAERKGKKPSLVRATWRVFGLHFTVIGLLSFTIECALRITQPLFLGRLVRHYADPIKAESGDQTEALMYALGVILCNWGYVFFGHPFIMATFHLGMKIRVGLCSMIYRKSLRISKAALGDTTVGQIVNLLSNDVGRLDTSIAHIHYIWIGPIELSIITYLMYQEIGYSSLIGVGTMLIFVPLQMWMGKKASIMRLRTALRTDERVRLMNEIISGIQVIKMYAWEFPFSKMINYIRKKEMNAIKYANYVRGAVGSFIMFLTRVSTFTSLVSYVLLGFVISAEKAFIITAFYSLLRNTMTVFFPTGLAQYAELMVSFKRIESYMLHEDAKTPQSIEITKDTNECNGNMESFKIIQENGKSIPAAKTSLTHGDHGILINKLKAKWDPKSTEYTLHNIDIRIKPKTMVAIIGPVGSGKSSILQAILRELPSESGSLTVNGTVSYASQEPWLFTGSVRQNILFGLPMDRERYRTVVKKCALERDFELFPNGDRTIVGERGASLSGGQKARISLARAVYRKANIYLLDDPLSAVDPHVGRHLFDQCMRGYLRNEIVVLVTHQLQFLEQADMIVLMENGKISGIGTFESLKRSGLDFANLLSDPERKDSGEAGSGGGGDATTNEKRSISRQNSRQPSIRDRMNSVVSFRSMRSMSISSLAESQVDTLDDMPTQEQESRQGGQIGMGLYQKYFNAGGSFCAFIFMVLLFVIAQILSSAGDYYISYWVNKNDVHAVVAPSQSIGNATRTDSQSLKPTDLNDIHSLENNLIDIYILSGLTAGTIIFALVRSFVFFDMADKSSQNLHDTMFQGITRTSMYFFFTNPSGRILNRFSKDLGQVDEILPQVMLDVLQIGLAMLGIVIVITMVNPWYLLATVILGIIFYFMRIFYIRTSRDVKRLEAVTRSPIYTHLSASLNGLATIRAFGAQKILISEFDNYQDLHSSGFYMFLSISRAFGYWLDSFCVLYIAIITFGFFVFKPENGGNVGLAITQAMGLTGMVQWGMRQTAELENTMTAVERVVEYQTIEPEGELESKGDKKPPKSWPEKGKIIFDDLSLRYAPDPASDRVLKSLDFEIEPCEKVGIVGRTGAGKSSLINAIFRLSYNEGSIIIDSRDTNELGLHDLRSKISIIPQEPVLFSGTMRYNLDPFDEYSDAKLWDALEQVKLKAAISELPSGLQSKISEGGSNFSVGQRQLVCLARAILRENRILVLDEATANVDPQTDALIQATIRDKFKDCTVLTIAHRLNTVMDSDKVLVMDAGRAVEFGSPYELLTKSTVNVFYSMVKQTGDSTFETLLQVAQKAHENNLNAKKDS